MNNQQELIDELGLGGSESIRLSAGGQMAAASLPRGWSAKTAKLDEAYRRHYETVLYQPETKKRQTIFLADLAVPSCTYRFSADGQETPELLVLVIDRPCAGEAVDVEIRVAANVSTKAVILECVPDVAFENQGNDSQRLEGEDLPTVTVHAALEDYARLDLVYVHPLYRGENQPYLRQEQQKFCLYRAELRDGAEFNWTSVNLADSLVEKGETVLNGRCALANIGGAAYIQNGAKQLYQSHVRCNFPGNNCRVDNHGVVENGGSGSFISISDIRKGARGTVAREDNRFMTLGEQAKAFIDPTLLIDEHDVTASHAATVGQVDETALFYLQSRGLERSQAARLMTAAFLTPLFDRITIETLRERLLEQFYAQIRIHEVIGEEGEDSDV